MIEMMRRGAWWGLVLLLAGCAATAPVPEDHFYRLGVLEAEGRFDVSPIDGVLAVQRIDAFGLLRDRALLYSEAATPQDLQRHHYHFWIDAPNDLIRDQLVQYLRDVGVARLVAAEHIELDGDVRLQLQLRDFSRRLQKGGTVSVRVELGAVLNPGKRGEPLLVNRYVREVQAANRSIAASVAAYDTALTQIYDDLTSDILKALAS